ncbi:MAG: Crp/Fnr family transcriptional regulator [Acidiferrobacterales bacterium]
MSKTDERRLRDIVRSLPEQQARTLLEFAEFLDARNRQTAGAGGVLVPAESAPVPADIPRPAQESVVKAIKRLAVTYPMLDRSKMLNETSSLMTQHVIQGRSSVEVIDELEVVFRSHYEKLLGGEDRK